MPPLKKIKLKNTTLCNAAAALLLCHKFMGYFGYTNVPPNNGPPFGKKNVTNLGGGVQFLEGLTNAIILILYLIYAIYSYFWDQLN